MSIEKSHDVPASVRARTPEGSLFRAAFATVVVTVLTFCCVGSVLGLIVLVALQHAAASPTVFASVLSVFALAIFAVSAKYGSLAWQDERYPNA